MKKKLKILVLFLLILLVLVMINFIGKWYHFRSAQNTVPNTQKPDTGNEFSEKNTSESNPFYSNNLNSETDSTSDSAAGTDSKPEASDNLPSDTASAESQETAAGTGSELIKEASSTALTREALRQLPAGTVINVNESGDTLMDNCFYYEDINEDIKSRIVGKSYKEDCTVSFEELRYVRVLYYGFDEETHIGELIVNKAVASDIADIFAELYAAKYPIEQMVLVDEYDADDNASMAANNTSSFNYRTVPGSAHLSRHALGLAIDINPLYNPYVQYSENGTVILPPEGKEYADRALDCPYYIKEDDLCYNAFTKRGFTWGGFWKKEPDYQHFQKTLK